MEILEQIEVKNYSVAKNILLSTEIPKETKSYKPVEHSKLIDLTLEGIEKAGFILDKETYSAAKNGQIAKASYTISNMKDSEMQLKIGWINSYNKAIRMGFVLGAEVFICENGVVRGSLGSFRRKHTGDIQEMTPTKINNYFSMAEEVFEQIQRDRDKLKGVIISPQVRAELLGRMYFEEEIIKADQIAIIKKELVVPTHDYKCEGSAWELYNHINFALKNAHPSLYYKQHSDLHEFFVEKSNLLTI